jgi:prefoldin alpha subunit
MDVVLCVLSFYTLPTTMAEQEIQLDQLNPTQLQEVKKQLDQVSYTRLNPLRWATELNCFQELDHLTTSYSQLKQAQNKFRSCVSDISEFTPASKGSLSPPFSWP